MPVPLTVRVRRYRVQLVFVFVFFIVIFQYHKSSSSFVPAPPQPKFDPPQQPLTHNSHLVDPPIAHQDSAFEQPAPPLPPSQQPPQLNDRLGAPDRLHNGANGAAAEAAVAAAELAAAAATTKVITGDKDTTSSSQVNNPQKNLQNSSPGVSNSDSNKPDSPRLPQIPQRGTDNTPKYTPGDNIVYIPPDHHTGRIRAVDQNLEPSYEDWLTLDIVGTGNAGTRLTGAGGPLLPRVARLPRPERFPAPNTISLPSGGTTLPRIQASSFYTQSAADRTERLRRLERTREVFRIAWNQYKRYAWGYDEIRPVSQTAFNPFAGWAATLVDALDTMQIMGLTTEFQEALGLLATIDFSTTFRQDIPMFETVIRYLGGLLAAYDLSQQREKVLLDKAIQLGDNLIGAFDTPNRFPRLHFKWQDTQQKYRERAGSSSNLAEFGSMSLEFTRLAQLTGNSTYYDAIDRITQALARKAPGLSKPYLFAPDLDTSGCNLVPLNPSAESAGQQAQRSLPLAPEAGVNAAESSASSSAVADGSIRTIPAALLSSDGIAVSSSTSPPAQSTSTTTTMASTPQNFQASSSVPATGSTSTTTFTPATVAPSFNSLQTVNTASTPVAVSPSTSTQTVAPTPTALPSTSSVSTPPAPSTSTTTFYAPSSPILSTVSVAPVASFSSQPAQVNTVSPATSSTPVSTVAPATPIIQGPTVNTIAPAATFATQGPAANTIAPVTTASPIQGGNMVYSSVVSQNYQANNLNNGGNAMPAFATSSISTYSSGTNNVQTLFNNPATPVAFFNAQNVFDNGANDNGANDEEDDEPENVEDEANAATSYIIIERRQLGVEFRVSTSASINGPGSVNVAVQAGGQVGNNDAAQGMTRTVYVNAATTPVAGSSAGKGVAQAFAQAGNAVAQANARVPVYAQGSQNEQAQVVAQPVQADTQVSQNEQAQAVAQPEQVNSQASPSAQTQTVYEPANVQTQEQVQAPPSAQTQTVEPVKVDTQEQAQAPSPASSHVLIDVHAQASTSVQGGQARPTLPSADTAATVAATTQAQIQRPTSFAIAASASASQSSPSSANVRASGQVNANIGNAAQDTTSSSENSGQSGSSRYSFGFSPFSGRFGFGSSRAAIGNWFHSRGIAKEDAVESQFAKRDLELGDFEKRQSTTTTGSNLKRVIAVYTGGQAALTGCQEQDLVVRDSQNGASISMGGGTDSTYEYYLKEYVLLNGANDQYRSLYTNTIDAANANLVYRPMVEGDPDILFMGGMVNRGGGFYQFDGQMSHLTCFAGGMYAMGAKIFNRPNDLDIARRLTQGCVWAYNITRTGTMPESFHVRRCPGSTANGATTTPCHFDFNTVDQVVQQDSNNIINNLRQQGISTSGYDAYTRMQKANVQVVSDGNGGTRWPVDGHYDLPRSFLDMDSRYILRPEALESVFYMYRITGEKIWQDQGWQMFESIVNASQIISSSGATQGYSGISDVSDNRPVSAQPDKYLDSAESFWWAETLKYAHLLFTDPDVVSLDEYVFNTEAHPVRRPST